MGHQPKTSKVLKTLIFIQIGAASIILADLFLFGKQPLVTFTPEDIEMGDLFQGSDDPLIDVSSLRAQHERYMEDGIIDANTAQITSASRTPLPSIKSSKKQKDEKQNADGPLEEPQEVVSLFDVIQQKRAQELQNIEPAAGVDRKLREIFQAAQGTQNDARQNQHKGAMLPRKGLRDQKNMDDVMAGLGVWDKRPAHRTSVISSRSAVSQNEGERSSHDLKKEPVLPIDPNLERAELSSVKKPITAEHEKTQPQMGAREALIAKAKEKLRMTSGETDSARDAEIPDNTAAVASVSDEALEGALSSSSDMGRVSNTRGATPKTDKSAKGKGKIVIIIDDMGVNLRSKLVEVMDGPLTLAYLPYAQNLQKRTERARNHGHEVMVHMPMEPMNGSLDGGPQVLEVAQDKETFINTLQWGLSQFEGYVGLNNHMGSRLTQDKESMAWLMDYIKGTGLYFIDSKTIGSSVAGEAARAHGIPYAERDIFLDHEISRDFVRGALKKLEYIANRKGHAIAIGHPHKHTISVLKEWLPTLDDKGLELVPASAVISYPAEYQAVAEAQGQHKPANDNNGVIAQSSSRVKDKVAN